MTQETPETIRKTPSNLIELGTNTKVAVVFPGQGLESAGTATQELYNKPSARAIFDKADILTQQKLGVKISEICLADPKDERLKDTRYSQVAQTTVTLARLTILQKEGLKIDVVTAQSLGYLSAAVLAGFIKPEQAIEIAIERGEACYKANLNRPGTMAAVLGLKSGEETLKRDCEALSTQNRWVGPSAINTGNDFVVSGDPVPVNQLLEKINDPSRNNDDRPRKTVPLDFIGYASHNTTHMSSAANRMRAIWESQKVKAGSILLVLNGKEIKTAEELIDYGSDEVAKVTNYQLTDTYLRQKGVTHLIEVCPIDGKGAQTRHTDNMNKGASHQIETLAW